MDRLRIQVTDLERELAAATAGTTQRERKWLDHKEAAARRALAAAAAHAAEVGSATRRAAEAEVRGQEGDYYLAFGLKAALRVRSQLLLRSRLEVLAGCYRGVTVVAIAPWRQQLTSQSMRNLLTRMYAELEGPPKTALEPARLLLFVTMSLGQRNNII